MLFFGFFGLCVIISIVGGIVDHYRHPKIRRYGSRLVFVKGEGNIPDMWLTPELAQIAKRGKR